MRICAQDVCSSADRSGRATGSEASVVDPGDLLVLLAIARSKTYSAAAVSLGVNHTTVARRVRALERSMGERLILPGPGGWDLTSAGRAALAAAEAVEAGVALVAGPAGSAAEPGLRGLVRVSSTEVFGLLVVAPALSELRRREPRVGFELTSITRPMPSYGPAADLDFGVARPSSKRVRAKRIVDYALGLFAARHYLAGRRPPENLADLAGHVPVYYVESVLRVAELDLVDRLFAKGAEVLGATSVLAQLEITRAGVGIGILPVYLASREPDLVRLLPDQATITLTYWMSARAENLRRPEVRAAAEAIERSAERVIRG
jgi:DNA-binding transcriptional LysR family regulator